MDFLGFLVPCVRKGFVASQSSGWLASPSPHFTADEIDASGLVWVIPYVPQLIIKIAWIFGQMLTGSGNRCHELSSHYCSVADGLKAFHWFDCVNVALTCVMSYIFFPKALRKGSFKERVHSWPQQDDVNSWPPTPDHSKMMLIADHQPLTTARW